MQTECICYAVYDEEADRRCILYKKWANRVYASKGQTNCIVYTYTRRVRQSVILEEDRLQSVHVFKEGQTECNTRRRQTAECTRIQGGSDRV